MVQDDFPKAQHGPKWIEDGPKMDPRWPQMGPKEAQDGSQKGSRGVPNRSSEAFQHQSPKSESEGQSEMSILRVLGALLGAI